MIVVAIILIVTTIAVPSLLRARQATNEAASAANMKSINIAENDYMSTRHAFATMSELVGDGLLDTRFQANLSGYQFAISVTNNQMDFTSTATAVSPTTGRYDYYSGVDYVVRYTTLAGRAPSGQAGLPVTGQ